MTAATTYLLTGDIGGTSSRMSLYATNTSCCKNEPLIEKKYRNHDALPDHVRAEPNAFGNYIIIPFLEYCWEQKQQQQHKVTLKPLEQSIIFCCLATAGVVSENKVKMTNLGNLFIDGNAIQAYHNRDRKNDPKEECLKVLKGLQTHTNGWVFNCPVDPVELGLPDYFQIIKKPMDLGTIQKKLEKSTSYTLDEFTSDVHLTFDNAMTYNNEGSVVYDMAKELKIKFEKDMKKELMATLEADNKSPMMLVDNKYLNRIVQCHIVNDFVAQGYGCLTLTENDVQHLHGPKIPPQELVKGPKVCVGAGTGLGECYLTQSHLDDEGTYTCFPSEGGHVEYAARNELEVALFHALNEKFSTKHRISVERVVSGTGLANVYEFLVEYYPHRVDVNLHERYVAAPPDEKPAIVSKRAHEEDDAEKKHHKHKKSSPSTKKNASHEPSLCRLAMDTMMSAYGCEVGSAAIKWIPIGGLFVTGGLTPKNMQFIEGKNSEFIKSYLHKGRVATLLERIPLYAVLVEDLGVRGAHKAAQMAFEKYTRQQHGGGSGGGRGSDGRWPWTTTTLLATAAAALGFAVGATLVKNKRL